MSNAFMGVLKRPLERLGTDRERGLSAVQAEANRKIHGKNFFADGDQTLLACRIQAAAAARKRRAQIAVC